MSISSCFSRTLVKSNPLQTKRIFSALLLKGLPHAATKPQCYTSLNASKTWVRNYADFDTRKIFKGDWICVECEAHNFQRNSNCFRCRAEVTDEAKLKVEKILKERGDWDCKNCNVSNLSYREVCFKCFAPK